MDRKTTNFLPQEHGFQFVNRFEIPNFDKIKSLMYLRQKKISLVYGLCGGMCFAALDHFFEHKQLPVYLKPEKIDITLFFYLWDRQLDSLTGSVLVKLFFWLMRGDRSLAKQVFTKEIPKLKNLIDMGQPAVLALIRVRFGNPTQNHQVIATAYEEDLATQILKISLYDPNHPGKEPYITVNLSNPTKGLEFHQSSGELLRGFFIIDYKSQEPPVFP